MNSSLDKKLVEDFPLLYADRHASMQSTCMCWGFECNDGWHDLIRRLSEKLEPLIQKFIDKEPNNNYHPRAAQVKEKFGGLRFYMTGATEEMYDLIHEAEAESEETCELCGSKDDVNMDDCGYWLTSRCKKCREDDRKRWTERLKNDQPINSPSVQQQDETI